MSDSQLHASRKAEDIFAEYLSRAVADESADFGVLCDRHRDLANQLLVLKSQWEAVAPILARVEQRGSLSERLRKKFGEGVDPDVSLEGNAPQADSGPTSELLRRLQEHGPTSERYKILGEFARGGMGAILRVWDEDLRRTLAMKVVLGREDPRAKSGTPPVEPKILGRFLEEAQVTGQLDHPGIVPVHELGLAADGRVYFTMRLVKGEDLKRIFEHVKTGDEGWNQVRALNVLLRVCEAMSFAHSKKVIHRDLKPANVMVGKFGEVYVMDWGLSRVLGREDKHDLRIKPQAMSTPSVRTERREQREGTPDSPLVTMDGDVVGTPSFMPPEQAKGQLDQLGPWSDVYSLGAMLYQLLTGQMPYVPAGARVSQYTILDAVLRRAPDPIESIAPSTPPELVAICEKAMARDPALRYRDMQAVAEDLRAYLEGRVVGAYETGTWAETRKWVQRNKPLAASLAASVIVLVSGVAAIVLESKNAELTTSEHAARVSENKAQHNAAIAEERAAKILRLSDAVRLSELEKLAESLWPARPDTIERFESWLADARLLVTRLPDHRVALEEIRSRATPGTAWTFTSPEDRWQHGVQQELVEHLAKLNSPSDGLLADVERRLEFARTVEQRTVSGDDARARWAEAMTAIADPSTCPKYAGLKFSPQLGLVPIGRDAHSGLWEFAHVQTGAVPLRDAGSGELALKEDSGIVFVLVPGGTFLMGAQARDASRPNYDSQARENESPVSEVTLDPFFISKYEMTQGQWLRFTGNNPSVYGPRSASNFDGKPHTLINPVEQVSWTECEQVLARLDLVLPTEAQWEYAARAGTSTPWSTGATRETLQGAANLADQAARRAGANWPAIADWPEFDDGFSIDAPVDALRPNPFGLHNMHGNVWEWCRDVYAPNYDDALEGGEGERTSGDERWRVNRGGSFYLSASYARSAFRNNSAPDERINHLGLRPARKLMK